MAWCDTDWVSRGVEHYAARLRSGSFGKRLEGADYAMWDYEPYNEGPVTCGCFCDRCRKAFADSLSLAKVPSGLEILARHKADWIKFRCRQRADVVRTVVAALKSVKPSVKFIFCSMPGDPGTDPDWMLKYGIDLSLYADFTDIYATMNYSQGLDFFRSFEDEIRSLRKETRMFISNGWGHGHNAQRAGMQLLAAFFGGVDYPFVGQGLYVSQCDQVAAFRKTMDFIARTEGRWGGARASAADKLRLTPGFRSEKSVYSLERRSADGTRHVMVFNNSERETAFAKLEIPGRGESAISIPPLSWKYVETTPEGCAALRSESVAAEAEEAKKRSEYSALFEDRKANGMSTSATPDNFTVRTPVQALKFDVRSNGIATWFVGGRTRGNMLGRDYFTTDGMFTEPAKSDCTVEASEIKSDRTDVTVAYRVVNAPYDGLLVRRRYSVMRDEPRIDVSVEVVPEGGYRLFRLRTGVNLKMAREMPSPTDVVSAYRCGAELDSGLKHVAFVREGAKFPDGNAFFVGKYAKAQHPLAGGECMVEDLSDGSKFLCRAKSPDEIFGWRERTSASVEFIFPDAYDHYDPHGVKTWKTSYSVSINSKNERSDGR